MLATKGSKRVHTLYYLPKQKRFITNCDDARYSAYLGGFGSGKTHILTIQSLRAGGGAFASRGLIGAPTYKMLEDTTQKKFFEICPPSWIADFQKAKGTVLLRNGSEILFRSLERPERLSGLDLNWFGLDEIGEVKEETFKMLQGRLRRFGPRNNGFGVGNPPGPSHWTYRYFVELALKHPEVYRLIQASSRENTFLPSHFVDDMDVSFGIGTTYHKRFVLGLFAAFEGAYWGDFNLDYYDDGGQKLRIDQVMGVFTSPPRFGKVVDFGFEHPLACLWYATDGESIVFFDEYVQQHALIKWHCLQIRDHEKEHQKWFGMHLIGPAYTDHDAVSRAEFSAAKDDDGNSIGFDCIPSEKRVMESILLVQTLINKRKLFIVEHCKETLRQVPSYRAKRDVIGEEPIKIDEDTCACIRYACWSEMQQTMTFKRYADAAYQSSNDLFDTHNINY